MSKPLVLVRLDDARYGAGPGTVVARPASIAEGLAAAYGGPDGARVTDLRLWGGDLPVGARVSLGTGQP